LGLVFVFFNIKVEVVMRRISDETLYIEAVRARKNGTTIHMAVDRTFRIHGHYNPAQFRRIMHRILAEELRDSGPAPLQAPPEETTLQWY
jgi:hypothetical protein